ncbi:MAG TPA: CBS domain-containing protein [Methylomirabilota bacterium]|nr:CBS domain-containing protein [Methylomirabilota bacterium]
MMSLQFLRVHEDATVAEVVARLRAADPAEEVLALCVVDDDGWLIGVVPIERLIFCELGTPLQQVARGRVVSVLPETSQDEVARIALRHRVWCIAVVDRERRPMGIIRIRDVIQSIREGGAKKRSLRRGLERLMQAGALTWPASAARYRLEASYIDMDTAYLRTLLARSLDPEKIRLGSFESTKIGGTGVRMCAELIAIVRNDRWIEQVAWRLSLEPGLTALSWQIVPPDGQ